MRNFLLIIVLLSSTLASAQNQPTASNNPPAEKVGFVDIEYVLSQLPEMKAMEQKLVEMQGKLRDDFTNKQQEYKKVFADYSGRYDAMDDSAKRMANEHIGQLQAELQGFNGEAQRTLENTRKLYIAPVYLKIGGAIADVAIANGYAMLIPIGIEGSNLVLYADPGVNASQLVVETMIQNSQQSSDKKAPATNDKAAPKKKN